MSVPEQPHGYQCEFVGSVPEYLYCKKCTLVAKRLTITNCCGESFCHECIADNSKSCPVCGEKDFNTFEQVKNRRRINCLQVYCSMKERGCDWSGTLEQLDTHLDPDQHNCQYMDTKCPLNCHMTIPKNKVEQHVAQHCAKRPYVCQHCNFKATYEEVVNKHLPECKYVPLQCPNLCGVTFERDFMEDHMKMCRLEEVGCEFSGVGCDGRFLREDQEEHTRQNSQKHLTLTASLAVETKEQLQQKLLEQDKKHKEEEEKHLTLTASLAVETKEQLQQKLLEQDKKHKEEEEKLKQKIEKQEKKIEELAKKDNEHNDEEQKLKKKIEEQEKKFEGQEKKFEGQEKKLNAQVIEHREEVVQKLAEQKKMLEELFESRLRCLDQQLTKKSNQNEINLKQVSGMISLDRTFKMTSFSAEKAKDKTSDWKSPAMYTHVGGYKFYIGVDANGYYFGRGKSVYVNVWGIPGNYDDQLKWPARAKLTIELINQQGRENATSTTSIITWKRPVTASRFGNFNRIEIGLGYCFIEHSKLGDFLVNDTLHFNVSKVEIL